MFFFITCSEYSWICELSFLISSCSVRLSCCIGSLLSLSLSTLGSWLSCSCAFSISFTSPFLVFSASLSWTLVLGLCIFYFLSLAFLYVKCDVMFCKLEIHFLSERYDDAWVFTDPFFQFRCNPWNVSFGYGLDALGKSCIWEKTWISNMYADAFP